MGEGQGWMHTSFEMGTKAMTEAAWGLGGGRTKDSVKSPVHTCRWEMGTGLRSSAG